VAGLTNESRSTPYTQAERSARTEERLLDAAEIVFARRGLAGTRVREIAAAAGMNPASLYNYYPSKEALYGAVLERGLRPLSALLAEVAASPEEPGSVHRIVRAVMQHLAERPHVCKLVYLEAISEGDFLPELARRWFRPILEQIMGELKARPTPAHIDEGLFVHVAALFLQLSFGHFALAPLLRESAGEDPTAAAGIESQTRLIEILIDQMFPHHSQEPLAGEE